MIKINLLPEEFRVKETKTDYIGYVRAGVAIGAIFILLTAFFYVDFLFSAAKMKEVDKRWKVVQPQFDELNKLQREVDGQLKQERDFMKQFVTTERPLTQLLEWASELLPESSWLTEIKLTQQKGVVNYLVKGLCLPSKEKTSIEQIDLYLQEFKKKMPDSNLTLQTTRNQILDVETTQFISNFVWGEEAKKA